MADHYEGQENEPNTIVPPLEEVTREERTWAMMCHLAAFGGFILPVAGHIICPLAVWLIKRDQFPLVDDQGKESLNFQITIAIAYFVSALLIVVLIGFFLLGFVALFNIVAIIVAAIRANEGFPYRYPFCIRFIK
jgi:uncharacterized Tic20 family protein